MDCKADRQGASVSECARGWSTKLMIGAALLAAIIAGGCTRNASSEWAQTAPVIKADAVRVSSLDQSLRGS